MNRLNYIEKQQQQQHQDDDDMGTDKQPRLSFYFESSSIKNNSNRDKMLDEVDRIEQLITLNLQKINENLINSNNIISNKLIPKLETFNKNSNNIYNNINHIKEFFENAANVNILTKKDIDINNIDNTTFNASLTEDSVDQNTSHNNTNITNNSTEFRDIRDRYKHNLEISSGNNNIISNNEENTNKNDMTPRIKRTNGYYSNNSDSINSETFLKDIEINVDDESTGRQINNKGLRNEFLESVDNKLDKEDHLIEDEEVEITSKLVKDIIAGYESPPWEDPPKLESMKYGGNIAMITSNTGKRKVKKRKIDESDEIFFGSVEYQDKGKDRSSHGGEEEEEEVSIRFPSSPKYGAGGKLLRSDEGRQIALDFARSEIMKNHPILSLQTQMNKQSTETPIKSYKEISNSIGGTNYDTTDSTMDDTPELISESLNRRQRQTGRDTKN
ncbi:hypothetical protein C6P40_003777 [Pichia californica]|uniref:DASH complex subunit ASK1 n=1 Tax=Pichia californica TaxID=460514 RepID=A0A9P6WG60_9ASCO|nr:hypothetical protein C6P40_003777 [[Candida] californica]